MQKFHFDTKPDYIWSFGEENYEILLKYIRIREELRDYTRALMREAHKKGTPVMRAMFYEFPGDPRCWDIRDVYLYGPDILVAPVCHKGATGRSVYLPQGAFWVSASDGVRYEGGQTVEAAAPIATVPVFLRDGRQEYLIGKV